MSIRRRTQLAASADPEAIRPASRQETLPIGLGALLLGGIALAIDAAHGYMLQYGDAVAHLGIARRILDNNAPSLGQLGGVWLPLPHLLMLPFIGRMEWWHSGLAGAWPSLLCYILATMGLFQLARRLMSPRWAVVATAFFALNVNLLYLSGTAMTEPLFLALLIWIVNLTLECVRALQSSSTAVVRSRLILIGLLILAAVMTRYDGWILGATVWCVLAWHLWQSPQMRQRVWPEFLTFTLLALAGPLAWFAYNHVYAHDWLDFMRGPYSAKEIDRKTSPPGSHHYFGWHNPAWSLMLYARTAQVDTAVWETGWLVAAAALFGGWTVWKTRLARVSLLLWLPLPFYVYSISYGSVPIFIPQLYPHAFYNSRYGMEMLPAFAIFATLALAALAHHFRTAKPLLIRLLPPAAVALIVLNSILMLHAVPLVLKEAMVNSRGRLAFEEPLTRELETFEQGATILMENSDHIGALQAAQIPLRQTIGPSDYYRWRQGLQAPAATANYVIALAGDDISKAIAAHPEGLTELTILCTSGQPCVRVYRSDRYTKAQP